MPAYKRKINIVTIGGGSGQYVLLSALRDLPRLKITAIVSMVDSGGSTGRLRDELGVLPPGDILKCILALSPYGKTARSILAKRFKHSHKLKGHSVGNMLLTMLAQYAGSFGEGIKALAEVLGVKGTILPVTTDRATLVAELTDGERIFGERAIDVPRGQQRKKIKEVYLVPHHTDTVTVYPSVLEAIKTADYIILGPGDLYTSIMPNLAVEGVASALRQARAPILYILNIMTKFGETHQFKALDFVKVIEKTLGRRLDIVIGNSGRPSTPALAKYQRQRADLVAIDPNSAFWRQRRLILANLIEENNNLIRHNKTKLAVVIKSLLSL